MSILPDNNKNIVGKAKPDKEVMRSGDWAAAKERADCDAAGRVVARLWSDQKTSKLREVLKDPDNVIFITQPSTSGQNVVPVVLAQVLSRAFKTEYIKGDDYFDALHTQQSKHIPQYRRAFDRRQYDTVDLPVLKEMIGDKHVVLVEDVLTTGGSVADFVHHLNSEGIKTESITALMGDKRLQIDQKTFEKLGTCLKNNAIPVSVPELAPHITRAEAGGLIMMINSARSEHAREKLTRNLQGLCDKRIVKNMGGDTISPGYQEPQGPDKGDASIAERVQAWPVQGRPKLITYESQKNKFLKSLERGKDKVPEKAIVKVVSKGIEY